MKHAPILTACACTAAALLWQFLLVHDKYADDWTAIYYTGAYTQVPPAIDNEQIYRFPGPGFDGQFYHFIAHDPWMRQGSARFVDNPRLRWRRILVPALAWTLALGQSDFVDSAYDGVMLGFVFLGTYWLSRFLSREGFSAVWGAAFLLIPAVLISLDRGTVDVALAALCVGFALYATEQSWMIYPILALAPLARETGLCLILVLRPSDFVPKTAPLRSRLSTRLPSRDRKGAVAETAGNHTVTELAHRKWRSILMLLPYAAWLIFLNAHTAADQTKFASLIPLQGLVSRTLHPQQYAVTSAWLKKAAALDYLAVLGVWAALLFVALTLWGRRFRLPTDPIHLSALAFAVVAIFLAQPQAWQEAYSFARTMSPLLIFTALLAVRARKWWGLIPLAATLPRIFFQLLTTLKSA